MEMRWAGAGLPMVLALLLLAVVGCAAELDAELNPPNVPMTSSEQVLEQLERAGSDVKKIAAVIQSAKEAGLPEAEMEIARRAAQRAILGDYSKNTKSKELAVQTLKRTLTDRKATAADKRRALDEAERQGVNAQNHYLFAEYVRQVEDAELRAEMDRQNELEPMLIFFDWLHSAVEGVGIGSRDILVASVVPALCVACLAAWRACSKPSAARLERELLADEAKEQEQRKSKRGNAKAVVRLAHSATSHCCCVSACLMSLASQAVVGRRREASKPQSIPSSKSARDESSTSKTWTPRYETDEQPEYAQPPVGELLDESAFQIVQKAQRKIAQRKISGGSADDSSSGAAPNYKETQAQSKGNGTGTQQNNKSIRSFTAPSTTVTVPVVDKQQAGKTPNHGDKCRSSPATANGGNGRAGRKQDVGVRKRSSEPREMHAAAGSKGNEGKEAVLRRRGADAEHGRQRRSGKHQAQGEGAATSPVVVKNAWFKNVPAPVSAPSSAPAPVVAKPKAMLKPARSPASEPVPNPAPTLAPEPSPEPNQAPSALAAATSKVTGWLPTVWSVGSTDAKTDSDEDDEDASLSYGSGVNNMPSPVPRLAFAGLPPPRIQLGGRADDSPASASAASIRFGDSPASSAAGAGIRFGAFPSPMGSHKQIGLEKGADSDDDWRASSQPQTSPASAAAAAAAKMFGGWGEPPSSKGGPGSTTRGARRSPTAGDGSSFSGRSKPSAGRSRSPAAGAVVDSSVTAARPPLPTGQSLGHTDTVTLEHTRHEQLSTVKRSISHPVACLKACLRRKQQGRSCKL